MIRYDLHCGTGHRFDGWFRSSDDFDAQSARKLVSCPVCGSDSVEKALMAPAVARTDRGETSVRAAEPAPATGPEAAPPPAAESSQPVALMGEREQELRSMLRAMREHITANADDVGEAFAEKARAMHYKEIEHRSIYGKATPEEARELHEEGIAFSPLPILPDDLS